ncbi:MAG TPA: hypothetical protein VFR75_01335 [Solirubrobacterales bacterium]|nr:hypothetical protein [Solirubrobacterales bacterium]
MSKKMMLLALSVVSAALFALPAIASATPAHISATENFTVSKGAAETAELETTGGEKVQCHKGVTGSGSWHSTTTGTLTLEFHECTTASPFGNLTCTTRTTEGGTSPETAGTIRTTHLEFHLITIAANSPGVLITPSAGTNHFAGFTCGGGLVSRTVIGNGILGTITAPACGVASTTATLKFEQGATTGLQKHTTYTGVNYHLESNGQKAVEVAEGKLTFPAPKTITCT